MFRNYLIIAWRNLSKNKLYTLVNMAGLTLGVTCCMLIGLYLSNELSYDKFNSNANRIVRVVMNYSQGEGKTERVALTGTKVGPAFSRELPQVESFVRTMKSKRVITYENKMFDEPNILYADSPFFRVFSFPIIQGNANEAVSTEDKIVLTRKSAEKYFGGDNPIGKILKIADKPYSVSAIAADPPANSQIQFDFVLSFNNLGASKSEEWWSANYVTYLLLHNPSQVETFQMAVNTYMVKVNKEINQNSDVKLGYGIEPLLSVHLHSSLNGLEPNGNILYVYILAVIAILILSIACVNYTNLATAQSTGRSAEIGVRKVMGAAPKQLFAQFLGESFFLCLISLLLAIGLSLLLLPSFNELAGKSMEASLLFRPGTLLLLLLLTLLISFCAGVYPSFLLARVKISGILKAGFSFTGGSGSLRKSLIVFQFIISVFLIITTMIVLRQLNYIRNKDLGYKKDHILVLPLDRKMKAGYYPLKEALGRIHGVESVSADYESPTFVQWTDGLSKSPDPNAKGISVRAMPVDLDFTKTLGIKILAGEDFTAADYQKMLDTSSNGKNIRLTFMLNEKAASALGWTPEQAIGKTIYKYYPGTVKAVVKDFHFSSLHDPIGPLMLFADTSQVFQFLVKTSGNNLPSTLAQLETIWKQWVPHRPFEYHFLDDDYHALYKSEQQAGKVFTIFSTLAISLACLGLFALAAWSTVQRTKEIGIRKVLGADLFQISALLSKDFVLLVFIAIVIASPVAWYAGNKWLSDFTYRTDLNWWLFPLAGGVALFIAVVTVCYHSIKAGLTNPVESLRSE